MLVGLEGFIRECTGAEEVRAIELHVEAVYP
jgi:hypothetical protein